jgi:hypothetical protein
VTEAPGESETMRDFRRWRLADFVRTETDAYIARVTPEPEIGPLFAQAATRTRRPAARSAPSVTVRTCRRCGAPREAGTIYGCCGFCGTPFFPNKAEPA